MGLSDTAVSVDVALVIAGVGTGAFVVATADGDATGRTSGAINPGTIAASPPHTIIHTQQLRDLAAGTAAATQAPGGSTVLAGDVTADAAEVRGATTDGRASLPIDELVRPADPSVVVR